MNVILDKSQFLAPQKINLPVLHTIQNEKDPVFFSPKPTSDKSHYAWQWKQK